jgi:hypothetical protein
MLCDSRVCSREQCCPLASAVGVGKKLEPLLYRYSPGIAADECTLCAGPHQAMRRTACTMARRRNVTHGVQRDARHAARGSRPASGLCTCSAGGRCGCFARSKPGAAACARDGSASARYLIAGACLTRLGCGLWPLAGNWKCNSGFEWGAWPTGSDAHCAVACFGASSRACRGSARNYCRTAQAHMRTHGHVHACMHCVRTAHLHALTNTLRKHTLWTFTQIRAHTCARKL